MIDLSSDGSSSEEETIVNTTVRSKKLQGLGQTVQQASTSKCSTPVQGKTKVNSVPEETGRREDLDARVDLMADLFEMNSAAADTTSSPKAISSKGKAARQSQIKSSTKPLEVKTTPKPAP